MVVKSAVEGMTRRAFSVSLGFAGAALIGNNQSLAQPDPPRMPLHNGLPPKCPQYPGPDCEDLFVRFKVGSREYRVPGPYRGVYFKDHIIAPRSGRIRQLESGSCIFLFPSGKSVRAEMLSRHLPIPTDDDLAVINIVDWQYMDETKETGLYYDRRNRSILFPDRPNSPREYASFRTKDGRPIYFGDHRIFDFERGFMARISFDEYYFDRIEEIWAIFVKLEDEWRVK